MLVKRMADALPAQFRVPDPELAKPDFTQVSIDKFVRSNNTKISTIIELCEGIAQGKVSPDRLAPSTVKDLASDINDLARPSINPFIRPLFCDSRCAEFPVESVSREAADLQSRTLSKFYEFATIYQVGSWLFDVGV